MHQHHVARLALSNELHDALGIGVGAERHVLDRHLHLHLDTARWQPSESASQNVRHGTGGERVSKRPSRDRRAHLKTSVMGQESASQNVCHGTGERVSKRLSWDRRARLKTSVMGQESASQNVRHGTGGERVSKRPLWDVGERVSKRPPWDRRARLKTSVIGRMIARFNVHNTNHGYIHTTNHGYVPTTWRLSISSFLMPFSIFQPMVPATQYPGMMICV